MEPAKNFPVDSFYPLIHLPFFQVSVYIMIIKIQQNIPLAPLTTFKIGGPAKFFTEVKTKEELAEAFAWAEKNKEKVFLLGGGSNVLINDKGVNGLVVKLSNNEINIKGTRLECGAGASLMAAARTAIGENLTGLEWAIGIPGTVGGAVQGNAGAYGKAISDNVETIAVFNLKKKSFFIYSNKDCRFGYKTSVFKNDGDNFQEIIWQVVLKAEKGEAGAIQQAAEQYLSQRSRSQPKLPSAGCVFINFDLEKLRESSPKLAAEAESLGIAKNGKVSAGWLVERLDMKGKTIGGAKVSLEHANFIVNTGKATAEDVITLISCIKQHARAKYNMQLQEEIQYIGF